MAATYMLINCESNAKEKIIDYLERLNNLGKVQGTYGAYDIIVKIAGPTLEELRETINQKLRKIDGVRSTVTLMETEEQY